MPLRKKKQEKIIEIGQPTNFEKQELPPEIQQAIEAKQQADKQQQISNFDNLPSQSAGGGEYGKLSEVLPPTGNYGPIQLSDANKPYHNILILTGKSVDTTHNPGPRIPTAEYGFISTNDQEPFVQAYSSDDLDGMELCTEKELSIAVDDPVYADGYQLLRNRLDATAAQPTLPGNYQQIEGAEAQHSSSDHYKPIGEPQPRPATQTMSPDNYNPIPAEAYRDPAAKNTAGAEYGSFNNNPAEPTHGNINITELNGDNKEVDMDIEEPSHDNEPEPGLARPIDTTNQSPQPPGNGNPNDSRALLAEKQEQHQAQKLQAQQNNPSVSERMSSNPN